MFIKCSLAICLKYAFFKIVCTLSVLVFLVYKQLFKILSDVFFECFLGKLIMSPDMAAKGNVYTFKGSYCINIICRLSEKGFSLKEHILLPTGSNSSLLE